MDQQRRDRINTVFRKHPLPKTLGKFIKRCGLDPAIFSEPDAWSLHVKAYQAIKHMGPTTQFYDIASILLTYLEARTGPLPALGQPALATRRQEKMDKRNRKNREATQKLASNLRRAKPSTRTQIADWQSAPKIGLGLESRLMPPPRARREDVVLDAHTSAADRSGSHHALYVAGWSLAEGGD